MKRLATLLIIGLAAGPLMASDGSGHQPAGDGSGANLSTKEGYSDLRQSAPGEIRISPHNDSR